MDQETGLIAWWWKALSLLASVSPFGFNCHQNQFSDSTDPCDALRKLTISKQKKEFEKLLTLIIKICQ